MKTKAKRTNRHTLCFSCAAPTPHGKLIVAENNAMTSIIRQVIDQEVNLALPASCLLPHANLYDFGLSAFDAVRLLVALERALNVEFPRNMLKREVISSIEAIIQAVRELKHAPAAHAMSKAA